MKVKAIKKGFYGLKRRNEGDTFFLKSSEHFSTNWMEEVKKEEEPKKVSKAKPKPAPKASSKEVI